MRLYLFSLITLICARSFADQQSLEMKTQVDAVWQVPSVSNSTIAPRDERNGKKWNHHNLKNNTNLTNLVQNLL